MVTRLLLPVARVARAAMPVRWVSAVLPERAPAVAPVRMGQVPTAALAVRPVTDTPPQPRVWRAAAVVPAVPVAMPRVRAPEVRVAPVGPEAAALRLRPLAAKPVPMVVRAGSAVPVVTQSMVWPVMAAAAGLQATAATADPASLATTSASVVSAVTVAQAVPAVTAERHQVVVAMAPVAMEVAPARVASVARALPATLPSR